MLALGILFVVFCGVFLLASTAWTKEDTPNLSRIRQALVIGFVFGVSFIIIDVGHANHNSEWTLQRTEITDHVTTADTHGRALHFDEPKVIEYWKYDDGVGITLSHVKHKLVIKDY